MRTSRLAVAEDLVICWRAQAMNSSTLAVLPTSRKWKWVSEVPAFWASAATCFRRSTRRAPSKSLDPSLANERAAAAPNPLEAPVIRTHLSFKEYCMATGIVRKAPKSKLQAPEKSQFLHASTIVRPCSPSPQPSPFGEREHCRQRVCKL